MTKAAEAKTVRAPSIKTLRRKIETNLLIQIEKATATPDWQAAQTWINAFETFQRSQNGHAPSSSETDTGAGGQQAALPGIVE